MVEKLKITDFEPYKDAVFSIQFTSEHSLNAILKEVNKLNSNADQERDSFSLLFQTDQTTEYFSQHLCNVKHPKLGEIQMFLVPIGLSIDEKKMLYEAIFN
jgi:hypothetical protein